MNKLLDYVNKSKKENAENKRKFIRNSFQKDVNKLEPYDNKEFLKMVSEIYKFFKIK